MIYRHMSNKSKDNEDKGLRQCIFSFIRNIKAESKTQYLYTLRYLKTKMLWDIQYVIKRKNIFSFHFTSLHFMYETFH